MKKDSSYVEFVEKVRSFEERIEKLRRKLEWRPTLWFLREKWGKKKEKIIEKFIDSVIGRFEVLVDAGMTNPLVVNFPRDSLYALSREKVEDTLARLEVLGFTAKYFAPAYSPWFSGSFIHISLPGEESEKKQED